MNENNQNKPALLKSQLTSQQNRRGIVKEELDDVVEAVVSSLLQRAFSIAVLGVYVGLLVEQVDDDLGLLVVSVDSVDCREEWGLPFSISDFQLLFWILQESLHDFLVGLFDCHMQRDVTRPVLDGGIRLVLEEQLDYGCASMMGREMKRCIHLLPSLLLFEDTQHQLFLCAASLNMGGSKCTKQD